MDDLLSEFLTETAESLELVDTQLVQFEQNPTDQATLNNIFRLVHTVKGTCGFLGLPRLEGVAHAGETLLGKFRDGVLPVTAEAVTLVLRAIDRIKEILVGLEATGNEPAGDDAPLLEDLHAAAEGRFTAAEAAPPTAAAPVEAHPPGPNGERWDPDMQRYLRPGEVSLAELEAAFHAATGPAEGAAPAPTATEVAAAAPAPKPTPARPALDHDDDDDGRGARGEAGGAQQTIRVPVEVLEQMMTMVSELVLTRNQLLQMVRGLNDSEFKVPLQRLSNITAELQDRVMKTRMQPVGNAWRKLPRIVRDAARDLKKKIDLRLEGEATELDRQVLEFIKDPLTHMVRNSCDHGLETPERRLAAGKSETGTIKLSAHHEGGHIIIEIADDGAGLNTARIREKLVEKQLVAATEVASLTDAQVHRYIFAPGFSTASQVTNMSGRGVGMDVVRTNIEAIGGTIELQSTEGRGATFRIKIPLTLAIVSALILGARGQRFACPQTSVLELVRVGPNAEHQIDTLNAAPVLRLRERLLPLVDLGALLRLPPTDMAADATRYVVVMHVGAQRLGLIVDEVHDTEEIVVKPLAALLRGAPMLSGATILGDGAVVLILDPNALSGAIGRSHEQAEAQDAAAANSAAAGKEEESLILFKAGSQALKAVPLKLVTRLEEVDASAIERADGRALLQYRGALMPVTHLAGDYGFRSEGKQPILVFTLGDRSFGLAVDEIVDVVHAHVTIDLAADRPGVIGAAVVRGKATEIVDVSSYLNAAEAEWLDRRGQRAAAKGRVLLVESNDFVRNLLAPMLQAAGYTATFEDSFEGALARRAAGDTFDVVLADVDADRTAAQRFAESLAADPAWADAPRVALSGETAAVHAFTDTVRKTDRAGLIAAIDYAVRQKDFAA